MVLILVICSFMDAEVASNSSYVWRSLLAARDVIFEGSKWKVGDGSRIKVSTHKWLSHKPIFLGDDQPNLYVKELIDSVSGQCNRETFFDLFAHKTRMEILQIPLSSVSVRDKLVWKENQSQTFTVKSAFQIAQLLKNQSRVENLRVGSQRKIWKKNLVFECTPRGPNIYLASIFKYPSYSY